MQRYTKFSDFPKRSRQNRTTSLQNRPIGIADTTPGLPLGERQEGPAEGMPLMDEFGAGGEGGAIPIRRRTLIMEAHFYLLIVISLAHIGNLET